MMSTSDVALVAAAMAGSRWCGTSRASRAATRRARLIVVIVWRPRGNMCDSEWRRVFGRVVHSQHRVGRCRTPFLIVIARSLSPSHPRPHPAPPVSTTTPSIAFPAIPATTRSHHPPRSPPSTSPPSPPRPRHHTPQRMLAAFSPLPLSSVRPDPHTPAPPPPPPILILIPLQIPFPFLQSDSIPLRILTCVASQTRLPFDV